MLRAYCNLGNVSGIDLEIGPNRLHDIALYEIAADFFVAVLQGKHVLSGM